MDEPDQRLFEADLRSAEYLGGVAKGRWGVAGADLLPEGLAWPKVVLWLAAPERSKAPPRYHALLDAKGYRAVSPTGTFWDPATKTVLAKDQRPKGKPDSRFAKVFRTDWKEGLVFYHPYDRVAAQEHPDWPKEQPNLIWDHTHTIADYLEEFWSLFQSPDYVGV
jgi:hypothetical protein